MLSAVKKVGEDPKWDGVFDNLPVPFGFYRAEAWTKWLRAADMHVGHIHHVHVCETVCSL